MSDWDDPRSIHYDRTPTVKIYQRGRKWWAHRTVGVGQTSPLSARSKKGIERKVRKWIDREMARQAQKEATSYTITVEKN